MIELGKPLLPARLIVTQSVDNRPKHRHNVFGVLFDNAPQLHFELVDERSGGAHVAQWIGLVFAVVQKVDPFPRVLEFVFNRLNPLLCQDGVKVEPKPRSLP